MLFHQLCHERLQMKFLNLPPDRIAVDAEPACGAALVSGVAFQYSCEQIHTQGTYRLFARGVKVEEQLHGFAHNFRY